jgi:hypothetical protein
VRDAYALFWSFPVALFFSHLEENWARLHPIVSSYSVYDGILGRVCLRADGCNYGLAFYGRRYTVNPIIIITS